MILSLSFSLSLTIYLYLYIYNHILLITLIEMITFKKGKRKKDVVLVSDHN